MSSRIRVVIVDDHPIFLAGLRNLIQSEQDLELLGEATNGLVALALIRDKQPDIAVLDISMPGLNGVKLARRLAEDCPAVRIVVLTLHEDRAYLTQAVDFGVRGYVLKRSAAESLVPALRAVHAGGLYIDPDISARMVSTRRIRAGTRPNPSVLTAREAEVLKQVALGLANKEIALQLGIGVKSVETFRARGSSKVGLRTRADIVRFAAAQGWLAEI